MNDRLNARGSSNTGLTLMGFALGAAVGAGVALLMAPDSGRNTRKRLGSTARRWGQGAEHTIDQARDAARRFGKGAEHTIDQARDAVAELGADAKSAIKAGQDAFRNDRAVRESRPGLNAGKPSSEQVAR